MGPLPVKNCRKFAAGMTLIEVLIALAIVAIVLTAVIKTVTQSIRATSYLQNKTIAMWVGVQAINEARLGLLALSPASDKEAYQTTMLGREWYWQGGQTETPNKRIRKIIINVFATNPENAEEATPLVTLESYVYREE